MSELILSTTNQITLKKKVTIYNKKRLLFIAINVDKI